MKWNILVLIAVGVICLSLPSCKVTGDSSTGQADIVFPTSGTVSYQRYVQPLFNEVCNYSGCHDDASQAGNLSLTGYINLKSAPGVVISKDTLHSILIQRVTGQGPIMPPAPFSSLNKNQIQGLKAWIMQGAQLN